MANVRFRDWAALWLACCCAAGLSGCASPTQQQGVQITAVDNKPEARGPLALGQQSPDAPLAVLKVSKLQLTVPLVVDAVAKAEERNRATDLNVFADRDLGKMLRDSKLFAEVAVGESPPGNAPVGGRAVTLTLSAAETSDRHTAGGVGKAFVSGFFTLGMASVAGKHTFTSEMTLTATRWDGATRTYKASSSVSAEWDQKAGTINRPAFQEAYQRTSVRATAENWRSLIGQMVRDAGFFATAP